MSDQELVRGFMQDFTAYMRKNSLPDGYSILQEDDTFYLLYQTMMTGYDFVDEASARKFCWERYDQGIIPMKSEEVI